MATASVRAVLFAKDGEGVAEFYTVVMGMTVVAGDDTHTVLRRDEFELVIHSIPKRIADGLHIDDPPRRRTGNVLRLDYAVENVEACRKLASGLGGIVDDEAAWGDGDDAFYLGHDPEGNPFGVSRRFGR